MKGSIEKKITVGFLLAFAIFVVVGVVQHRIMLKLVETSHRVATSEEVLEELEATFSTVNNAETGARRYVITGKESYLEPYDAAISNTNEHIQHLREMTADNPHQQRRLDTLGHLIANRFAAFQKAIKLRRDKGFSDANQLTLTGKGKKPKDAIRDCMRLMQNEEQELMKQRVEAAEVNARNIAYLITCGSFVGLGLLVLASFITHREITKRTQAEIRVQQRTTELAKANEALEAEITERKRAEAGLQQPNEKLTSWVKELERQSRDTTLLSEMGELLHSCLAAEEAYTIIAQFAPQLFPAASGALCVLSASKNLVEGVAVWGESRPNEWMFAPDECWALRRGLVHWVEDSRSGLLCPHLRQRPSAGYLCVPMMAQGEALGVLHLQSGAHGLTEPQGPEGVRERLTESKQRLAVTVAENIALALANLKLREALRIQSIRDPLTGLFNRRYMEESLERELRRAARNRRPLAAIMLDLDHFKRFNDTSGHEAGDTLLQALGNLLRRRVREEDIACRYGGEEFTLILPDASLDAARQRAEQLREEAKHLQVQHRGRYLGAVTLSVGVAAFPEDGSTAREILWAADEALYRAKAEGRDRVVVSSNRTGFSATVAEASNAIDV